MYLTLVVVVNENEIKVLVHVAGTFKVRALHFAECENKRRLLG